MHGLGYMVLLQHLAYLLQGRKVNGYFFVGIQRLFGYFVAAGG